MRYSLIARRFTEIALLSALTACTTKADSNPPRTATEEMLISTAADRAAQKFAMNLRPDSKVFVDATNFEGTDSKYAIGALRTAFLKSGAALVDDKKKADVVVEIRAGALSTDRDIFLIGVPSFNIPIPLAGSLPFPELAIYKDSTQTGIAKFAATVYTAEDGHLVAVQDPQYGYSHDKNYTAFFFLSWEHNDAVPKEEDEEAPKRDNKAATQ